MNVIAPNPTSDAVLPSLVNLAVKPLFPSPVITADVAGHEALNATLLPLILTRQAVQGSVARTNRGGWQSADDFTRWSGESGANLLTVARQLANQLTLLHENNDLRPLAYDWRINAWANVNAPGDFNAPHHHAGAFWSGVYYVETGGLETMPDYDGAIEFHDPRGVMPLLYAPQLRFGVKGCLSAGISELHRPRPGQLLLVSILAGAWRAALSWPAPPDLDRLQSVPVMMR